MQGEQEVLHKTLTPALTVDKQQHRRNRVAANHMQHEQGSLGQEVSHLLRLTKSFARLAHDSEQCSTSWSQHSLSLNQACGSVLRAQETMRSQN